MPDNATDKKRFKIIIELDSPSSRTMDLSPAAMAKILGWSINTVKERINALSLGVKDAFSIHNDGNYQMYNHECLPILKAFIGTRKEKPWLYTKDEFLQAAARELDADTSQIFCRHYLYNQDVFRKFYLRQKLDDPIRKRLACIKHLSQKLDIYPGNQSTLPFQVQSIGYSVMQLDRIIYELSNFVPPTEESESTPQPVKNDTSPALELTQMWCRELLARRKKISTREGICCEGESSDPTTALEQMLSKTLTDTEKKRAEDLTSVLQQIDLQSSVCPLDEDGLNKLEWDVQTLLLFNMKQYLSDVFDTKTITEFTIPEGTTLAPFVCELTREAYNTMRYASEEMEKNLFVLKIWFILNEEYFDHYVKDDVVFSYNTVKNSEIILQRIEKQIKTQWESMPTMGNALPDQLWQTIFADAINISEISNQKYGTMEHKQDCIDFLTVIVEGSDEKPRNVASLLLAGSVTLEYFWRKNISQWAGIIAHRYNEYQNARNPFM